MLIAQISDLHVRPEGLLYADRVPSNAMAEAAVRHLNALRPRPDLVLVTGDVADQGTEAEYAVARQILAPLDCPMLLIPGNHDEREAFRRAFAQQAPLPAAGPLHSATQAGPLQIVAFDSCVPGAHHGDSDAAGLAWLEWALGRDPGRPALVLMHHHPFISGIPFLDDYILRSGAAIEAVIGAFGHVERLLCGHTHRFMARRFGGTLAMSCPSTASQIALRLDPDAKPASFFEPPACLLHHWRPDTGLVTHLSPIGNFGTPLDFT